VPAAIIGKTAHIDNDLLLGIELVPGSPLAESFLAAPVLSGRSLSDPDP
jgi:hypothetical protein